MGTFFGQRRRPSSSSGGWKIKFALLGVLLSIFVQGVFCEGEPTESECRPYIEKALKEQHLDIEGKHIEEALNEQEENPPTDELTDSTEGTLPKDTESAEEKDEDDDDGEVQKGEGDDDDNVEGDKEGDDDDGEINTEEDDGKTEEQDEDAADEDKKEDESMEKDGLEVESVEENDNKEDDDDDKQEGATEEQEGEDTEEGEGMEADEDGKDEKSLEKENDDDDNDDERESILERPIEVEVQEVEMGDDDDEDNDADDDDEKDKDEETDDENTKEMKDDVKQEEEQLAEADVEGDTKDDKSVDKDDGDDEDEDKTTEKVDDDDDKTEEKENDEDDDKTKEKDEEDAEDVKETEGEDDNVTEEDKKEESDDSDDDKTETTDDVKKDEDEDEGEDAVEVKIEKREVKKVEKEKAAESEEAEESKEDGDQESTPEEEELIKEVVIPDNLRPRDHINKILKLDEVEMETILEKTIDATLKSLKGLYDNAIKPLEMLYKYRDLSNRHFGDPEIFSKPLILFMGPWSGGKSSTINYLLDNEFSHTSLRTGAEPSPAYFNILMHGEREEILDGTQLAADWTFSGLQKFGQSLLDRLRGIKLPNKLLEKVNIVEIPGILEIRKQVQRLFPFNDACQWFIDRADIIFLVYDPSKLDVGPETEAILDQLKGREYQTRIILNKADQVKPEELMRVQGTLIWNISPLMSSSEPPIMYSTSLWSLPYEAGAPTRLLLAQERAFLRDLREAIDKRVENKIASARRFAVRVRNHAKMVDCYLTTYYNHKSFFGNRKKISDDIIEYPQKYHIYEGLSTLTNISRYDLPDPDVYRDFFKINPLYEFKKLSETCTYFRGCPINQLDVAIAYDLPEMVGKYKKAVETAKEQQQKENS